MRKSILFILLICCICAGISAASAQTLSASNATIDTGETTLILILLDEAPEGLSGYNITVSLTNTAVADITDVTFPDWPALHYNSDLPTDSLAFSGVDLNEEIDAGATNIELAQITVEGIAPGEAGIAFDAIQMDDDSGNLITPVILQGTLVVEGEPIATLTPGSGGNGGTSVPTTTATVTGTATEPTTAPTGETTTTEPTTAPTGEGTEVPTATPTEQPGFGALLALAAVGAAAVLLTRDR